MRQTIKNSKLIEHKGFEIMDILLDILLLFTKID